MTTQERIPALLSASAGIPRSGSRDDALLVILDERERLVGGELSVVPALRDLADDAGFDEDLEAVEDALVGRAGGTLRWRRRS